MCEAGVRNLRASPPSLWRTRRQVADESQVRLARTLRSSVRASVTNVRLAEICPDGEHPR
jgi:hypothetical protein